MNDSRRQFLAAASSLLGAGFASQFSAPQLLAQQPPFDIERLAAQLIKPSTQQAIDRALAWLGRRQNDDGSFGGSGYSRNVAVVSLAGMAFLAAGNTPGRGEYGGNLNRCISYVLSAADESGFISIPATASHGPMYDHGFATLFLAEVYGMTPDSDVREKLHRAVRLIVTTQNNEGGWRYQPKPLEADISVTICQVMALRAARNAGLFVPNETIDRCIDYVKRSQNADGGFMYMLSGGPSKFPRSAAGIVALYSAGIYEGDEIRKGLEYISQQIPRPEDFSRDTHAMYGHYYATQAMWQAGGEHWQKWYPAIHDVLLKAQQADGSWMDLICAEYGTAMACIILQMPNNYLPIFQR
ncbi:Prenyltransferase and squalene oxidase repeat protein [Anatilimnocola aggregata]|uniref:Prenyltransferase and squalene oxidase repeat protein n=1 Tax=Anatilimnocola aggregata TaxID=2528021 RepID=A0A517YNU8_9BACT|nr:prenyltransferase/squalene oxidase repeat-containing protein [Anatilimnocola aggregata]QDU31898.1 Prenyltransferase and squalene oxidase repeat protein [Anatilimnocola aggregata]